MTKIVARSVDGERRDRLVGLGCRYDHSERAAARVLLEEAAKSAFADRRGVTVAQQGRAVASTPPFAMCKERATRSVFPGGKHRPPPGAIIAGGGDDQDVAVTRNRDHCAESERPVDRRCRVPATLDQRQARAELCGECDQPDRWDVCATALS